MAIYKLPSYGGLQDGQFVTVEGPNGISTGFSYDLQTRAFYFKESQVVYPSFHGLTHISEDPIPSATCDTPGLMSSIAKCRLDTLLQTRVGVLGFQGSGFPEDGGWLSGDIILAAGSGFISLERFGNVVRFTVDSPVPLNCSCESCNQIFWVQDETDASPAGVRPPVCSGKLPNIDGYGEFKIYQFPTSTIVDSANPAATLNRKDLYPAILFKRYTGGATPNTASFEVILKRDSDNALVTDVGMAFTPPTNGTTRGQLIYYLGKDADGNRIKYEFKSESVAALYGALTYKGNLLTKMSAVIIDYSPTVLSTNVYVMRMWDNINNVAVGSSFQATNNWQWKNPENPSSGTNPKVKVLDVTIDILPIGTLVDLWYYQSPSTTTPVYFFNKKPPFNPNYSWGWVGHTQFGDTKIARKEVQASGINVLSNLAKQVSADRDFEKREWGLTGWDDPLATFYYADALGITEGDITYQHRAVIDTNLPGLRVQSSTSTAVNYMERPVYLWHRKSINNAMIRLDIGRPQTGAYTPVDIIIRGAIDEHTEKYMKVVGSGILDGRYYVRVVGASFSELPKRGTIRALPRTFGNNLVFNYDRKVMFPYGTDITAEQFNFVEGYGTVGSNGIWDDGSLGNSVVLIAPADENFVYAGGVGDIVELCHQEFNNTILRCEFWQLPSGTVLNQFKVGTLDMSRGYEDDNIGSSDDLVRGLAPGYSVSAKYQQSSTYTGVGTLPTTNLAGYIAYEGGAVVGGTASEYWNRLEVMVRDDQLWVWWNKLLIPPDAKESAALPSPVKITNPHFTIPYDSTNAFGKYGVRMFPLSSLRRVDIRAQMTLMSEFAYGQLDIVQ